MTNETGKPKVHGAASGISSEEGGPLPRFAILTNSLDGRYQSDVLRGIVSFLYKKASILTLVIANRDSNAEEDTAYLRHLPDLELIDGLVILSGALGLSPTDVKRIAQHYEVSGKRTLPIISVGVPCAGVPVVLTRDKEGVRSAVEHLLKEHQFRRIAFLAGPSCSSEAESRLAGFEAGLGPNFQKDLVVPNGNFTFRHGYLATQDLLNRRTDIEGIIAANDEMARGALSARKELRPHSILPAVVGFDDTEYAFASGPTLTTVRQPLEQVGMRAAESLLQMHASHATSCEIPALQTALQVRESCGCPVRTQTASTPSQRQLAISLSQLVPTKTSARELRRLVSNLLQDPRNWTDSSRELTQFATTAMGQRLGLATSSDIGIWHNALVALRDSARALLPATPGLKDAIAELFDELARMIVNEAQLLAVRTGTQLQVLRELRSSPDLEIRSGPRSGNMPFSRLLESKLQQLRIRNWYVAVRDVAATDSSDPVSILVASSGPRETGAQGNQSPRQKTKETFRTRRVLPDARLPANSVVYFFAGPDSEGHVVFELDQPRDWWVLGEAAETIALAFRAVLQEGVVLPQGPRNRDAWSLLLPPRHMRGTLPEHQDLNFWREVLEAELARLRLEVKFDRATVQLVSNQERSLFFALGYDYERQTTRSDTLLRPIDVDELLKPIFKEGKPFFANDTLRIPHWDRLNPDIAQIRSWVGAPILDGTEPVGFLALDFCEKAQNLEEHRETIEGFLPRLAFVLSAVLPLERERQREDITKRVAASISRIARQLDSTAVLASIAKQVAEHTKCSRCVIFLPDKADGGKVLKPRYSEGPGTAPTRVFSVGSNGGLAGNVFETGDTLLFHDARGDSRFLASDPPSSSPRSMLLAPIQVCGQNIGVISADKDSTSWFTQDDKLLVKALGEQAGIAIQRADMIAAMQGVASSVLASGDRRAIGKSVLEKAITLTNADAGALFLFGNDSRTISERLMSPGTLAQPDFDYDLLPVPAREELAKAKTWSCEILSEQVVSRNAFANGYESVLLVPLLRGDQRIGVILVYDQRPRRFTDTEIAPLQVLASLGAIGLEKVSLLEDQFVYERHLAMDILPGVDDWNNFLSSLRRSRDTQASHPDFIGPARVLWTEYQRRRARPLPEVGSNAEAEFGDYAVLLRFISGESPLTPQVVDSTYAVLRVTRQDDGATSRQGHGAR